MLLRGRFIDRLAGSAGGLVLGLGLLWSSAAAADLAAGAGPRLAEVLQSGQATALALTWTIGRPGELRGAPVDVAHDMQAHVTTLGASDGAHDRTRPAQPKIIPRTV